MIILAYTKKINESPEGRGYGTTDHWERFSADDEGMASAQQKFKALLERPDLYCASLAMEFDTTECL